MLANSNRGIADKLFYGIVALLVLILGILGSILIYQRISDISRKTERRMETTANYLERILPPSVFKLDAKRIRQDIDSTASDELQAVEIFDADNERIYVYERYGGKVTYDKRIERDLIYSGSAVGKMAAYFSMQRSMQSIRLKELFRLIIFISASGLVLAIGIYFFVRKIIIKPIEATLFFSEAVASGDYSKRIDVITSDEMGALQNSLNKMADALQESVENLKASFYEAEGARQQAIEASRLKSEFLASMSHEIRTPLNAIIGYADILFEDEKNSDRRESLKTIKNSANILLENINDILDLSKLEAGKLKLFESDFSLSELVDEISPIIKLRLHGKNVVFSSMISDELKYKMRGDRIRLRQVLLNILINAAKFTHHGRIELFITSDEAHSNTILFKVIDTGIGIPKEHHKIIFEPFTQVDGTITREFSGTGLGLAIAKRLVEMMGGHIWLESTANHGTTFYFTIRTV